MLGKLLATSLLTPPPISWPRFSWGLVFLSCSSAFVVSVASSLYPPFASVLLLVDDFGFIFGFYALFPFYGDFVGAVISPGLVLDSYDYGDFLPVGVVIPFCLISGTYYYISALSLSSSWTSPSSSSSSLSSTSWTPPSSSSSSLSRSHLFSFS